MGEHYPRMLYRSDGSYRIVEDADEEAQAEAEGWGHTPPPRAEDASPPEGEGAG